MSKAFAPVRRADSPAAVAEAAARTPGFALARAEREHFEARYGHDFAKVRIHTGGEATAELSAIAFTVRNDIFVAPQDWRPGTRETRAILAHELAHVLQQAPARTGSGRPVAGEGSAAIEAEAGLAAARVLAGGGVQPDGLSAASPAPAFLLRAPTAPTVALAHEMEHARELDPSDRDGSQAQWRESLDHRDRAEAEELDASRRRIGFGDETALEATPPAWEKRVRPGAFAAPQPSRPAAKALPNPPPRRDRMRPATQASRPSSSPSGLQEKVGQQVAAAKAQQDKAVADAAAAIAPQAESPIEETPAGTGAPRPASAAPPAMAAGMSGAEIEARERALLAAEEIEVALANSLRSLKAGRKAANKLLVGSAAAARRTLTQRVKAEKDKFESSWEQQDILLGLDILKERDDLKADFDARRREATERVGKSVEQTARLFAQHRPNMMLAAADGAAAVETARIRNREDITKDYEASKRKVEEIGRIERAKFGFSDRDFAQRDGVRWVENKIEHEMDERLPDALAAIDQLFQKQPDPRLNATVRAMGVESYVTVADLVRDGAAQALEGYNAGEPAILAQLQQMLAPTLRSLEFCHAEETRALDTLEKTAAAQLQVLKVAGLGRFEALSKDANERVDRALTQAQSGLSQAERSVRRQLEPVGNEAVRQLWEEDPPDPDEAADVAADIAGYFEASTDFATDAMAGGAAEASQGFWRVVRETQTAATGELKESTPSLLAVGLEAGDKLSHLHQWRTGEMKLALDDLHITLDEDDADLKDKFKAMIDAFKAHVDKTIGEVNAIVADAVKGGKDKNREAIGKVADAMREEADDCAKHYDHPWIYGARDVIHTIVSSLRAVISLVGSLAYGLLKYAGLVIGLLIFEIPLAAAEFIATVAMIGYMVYQGLQDYAARRERGQSERSALLGAAGDITGLGEVWHGWNDPYLKLWERAEKITGGAGTAAALFFNKRINKLLLGIGATRVPWLMRKAGLERAAGFVESVPERLADPNLQGWVPRSLKRSLSAWWETRAGGKGKGAAARETPGGKPSHAPAALAPPVVELPVVEPPVVEPPRGGPQATDLPPAPKLEPPPPAPKTPSTAVELPQVVPPRAANDNAPNAPKIDEPPPSGRLPKKDRPDNVPEPPNRAAQPKKPSHGNAPANEAEQAFAIEQTNVTEVQAANDYAYDVNVKVAVNQSPVMASRQGAGGKGGGGTGQGGPPPRPPMSTAPPPPLSGGRSRPSPKAPRTPEPPREVPPETAPGEGEGDREVAPPTTGGPGGKVIQLRQPGQQPAQGTPAHGITARPKDAPPPEGTSGEETLVGKTRTRGTPKEESYRQIADEDYPQTVIYDPVENHHFVLKRGGSLLSDLMREMLATEGIEVWTEPANLLPMTALKGSRPRTRGGTGQPRGARPDYGAIAHKEMHNLRSEQDALRELLGGGEEGQAQVEEIMARFGDLRQEWLRRRREATAESTGIPDDRLQVLQRGRLTKAKLEELGFLDEGARMTKLFGVNPSHHDLRGGLRRLKGERVEPEEEK